MSIKRTNKKKMFYWSRLLQGHPSDLQDVGGTSSGVRGSSLLYSPPKLNSRVVSSLPSPRKRKRNDVQAHHQGGVIPIGTKQINICFAAAEVEITKVVRKSRDLGSRDR